MLRDDLLASAANPCRLYLQQLAGASLVAGLTAPYGQGPAQTLLGSIPWKTATDYTAPVIVSSNGNLYALVGAGGTSGATAPIGAGQVSDGTLNWEYLGAQQAPAMSVSGAHNAALSHTYALNSNITAPRTGFVRFGGGTPVAQPAQGTGVTIQNEVVSVASGNLGNGANSTYSRFTSGHNGTKYEFQIYAFAAGVKAAVKVNGIYLDSQFISTTNGYWYITLDFTGVGLGSRIIEIETSQVYGVGQIATEPTGTFYYPSLEQDWGVVALGDSQTQSVGDTNNTTWQNYLVLLAKQLGWPDIMPSGIGGTGFVATDGGTQANYMGRALAELARYSSWRNVGAILLQCSSNDIGASQLQTNISATITMIRAQYNYSLVPIYVIGCITGGATSVANGLAVEAAAQAAITQLQAQNVPGLYFIPVAGTIYGTGNESAPNGSGPADVLIGPDGFHLTAAGHDFHSRIVTMGIRQSLANSLC